MKISQHLCLTDIREIFRKHLCVLRERLVHNCKLWPLLQVTLTRLSPSRLTIRNLLLIWWFFTAGNLFIYSWIEWKWVLYVFSSHFHGPFIISKPICLRTSLTKLGKQSSRSNQQLLARGVITKHKASWQQLPHKHSFQKHGSSEAVSGENLQRTVRVLIMFNLKQRFAFPIP